MFKMYKDMGLVLGTGENTFILNFKKDASLQRFAVCHHCVTLFPQKCRHHRLILQVKSQSLVRMRDLPVEMELDC